MSLRISMSMLLCFLLVVGVVVASMVLVSKVGTLQEYLDKVSTYALEVENTRHYRVPYDGCHARGRVRGGLCLPR